jgi:hypothetical protein
VCQIVTIFGGKSFHRSFCCFCSQLHPFHKTQVGSALTDESEEAQVRLLYALTNQCQDVLKIAAQGGWDAAAAAAQQQRIADERRKKREEKERGEAGGEEGEDGEGAEPEGGKEREKKRRDRSIKEPFLDFFGVVVKAQETLDVIREHRVSPKLTL